MQLSKRQVQEIDAYLKKVGVKCWDIRIEMLDHIVTDIEQIMEKTGKPFSVAKEISLERLSRNTSFENEASKQMKIINRKVKRRYFREMVSFFSRPSTFILIILSTIFLFFLYDSLGYMVIKRITAVLTLSPAVVILFLMIRSLNIKKSAYLDYGASYLVVSISLLNLALILLNDAELTEDSQRWCYFAIVIVNSILMFAGIKTYLTIRKSIVNIKTQLNLL